MHSLCSILRIHWQDKVSNLERANTTSIEAMIFKVQLHWTGHVILMDETRIPRQLLYGELSQGHPYACATRTSSKLTYSMQTFTQRNLRLLPLTEDDGMHSRRSPTSPLRNVAANTCWKKEKKGTVQHRQHHY